TDRQTRKVHRFSASLTACVLLSCVLTFSSHTQSSHYRAETYREVVWLAREFACNQCNPKRGLIMGTELSKQQQGGEDEDEALDARSTTATTLPLPLVAEKWHDWLQGAESLYIQGRFRAYQKALRKDAPSLPSDPMAAALLKAVARANAAIGRHAEASRVSSGLQGGGGGGGGGGVGGVVRGEGKGVPVGDDGNKNSEARDASLASLEKALRETVDVALQATSSSSSLAAAAGAAGAAGAADAAGAGAATSSAAAGAASSSCAAAGRSSPIGAGARQASGLRARPGVAVIAAAAEDVAVQVACAVMATRLAQGEPTKAVSVGLRLLARRQTTVAAAAFVFAEVGAAHVNDETVGPETTTTATRGGGGGSRRGRQDSSGGGGGGGGGGGERQQDGKCKAARDVFFGVDALRKAFESALSGPAIGGRRLPLQEAAPRLLHLLRLSWLLAVANLALGRAAVAAQFVLVAETAYGTRPSAWRKASFLLATHPPGGASAAYAPRSRCLGLVAASARASANGNCGRGLGGAGARAGAGAGRDPALSMCRFLRGLALLAQGDLESAAGRLEESLELDPRNRHATVCLAHTYCFAAAAAAAAPAGGGGDGGLPPPPPQLPPPTTTPQRQRWKPSDERIRELLRLLSLGASAHFESAEQQELLLRGGGSRAGGERRQAAAKGEEEEEDSAGSGGGGGGEYGGGVETWVLLACVARARGDAGGAVSMFRRVLALDPHCLEAVYGIARVLQESGDHATSRDLLLFLGERSQEISSSIGDDNPTTTTTTKNSRGGSESGSGSSCHGRPSPRERRRSHLCFPLDIDAGGRRPGIREDRSWIGGGGGGGGGAAGAAMLPVATAEVMWRVARASMGAKDWSTAILALRGLAAELLSRATSPFPKKDNAQLFFFASSRKGGDGFSASPGPARARVLRALAFCQIQRGLYRDALETTSEGLGRAAGGSSGGGGAAEGDDAAMLMLRADALLCLEEGEAVVEASLDRATQLLNLRQIDMSLPPPPPPRSSSSSPPPPPAIRTTAARRRQQEQQQQQKQQSAVTITLTTPPPPPPPPPYPGNNNNNNNNNNNTNSGENEGVVAPPPPHPRDLAVDRDRRLARSAAFNNRAVLLVAAGRGEEACRLLRACLLLLPGEPRPVFNLTLALWRLGRRRAACAHWLEARGWLGDVGGGGAGGGGGGGGGGMANTEAFAKLLDSACRRKALLKPDAAVRRNTYGGGQGNPSSSSFPTAGFHVTEGEGDPLSLPPLQLCLLDIRCLTWWIDNDL
ncbi:unnamed protein product, partial [Pylaiella littoralis]